MSRLNVDVAIVGYGPVGAMLANLLGVAGLSVAVIERHTDPYSLPRATHIDGEAMRVLQTAGLAQDVAATLGVHPRMQFINAQGRLLIDWTRSTQPGPTGWRDSNRFHQPELEMILRSGVGRFPGHVVLAGCELNGLREDEDQVVAGYTRTADGTSGEVHARYVVGCDGANSRVRALMGSAVEVLADPAQWLVVDALLTEPVPSLPSGTVQYCDPARPITSIECVGGRHRWEIKLMPGDDAATFAEPDNVWPKLKRWLTPQQARIERSVVYTFRAALAECWRRGRLLLAGDAAHQTPPFLGQGLCAGVRDAANLAWKLQWVLKGRAPQSLLDSYQQEQAPHVRAFIHEALRIGQIIQVTDPHAAALRDQELVERPQMLTSIRPSLGAGLHAGLPAPAGTLSQQPALANGRRMDDVAGLRFVILGSREILDGVSPATREIWQRADALILADEGAAYLAQLGYPCVIVRPDRYILAAAHSAAELDAASALIPSARD
ncbi:bifunctional 3-(3-hydroxy-phenyl)propionate/3-hydroxycinnamic acid hydroxylase MhpA [Variovorax ginsengisoli]|uniref:3-(3-hydroxy-phenyl)propionate hydroxylase n=1 Tax=Variovorax ginsengisoli TaxID=363844 RepID=A0ABT9SC93_9BURK|nr:bifunctional 3-(3-hydroxy-phenyl)propionate/3-hydroxycinnamic acid hydroxylase [Variovorax ginsengisoli]MDP9901956.1 3-(3-hydroxy-phenyl)propionate hydroxylase [Variovorax ginsengisoli]